MFRNSLNQPSGRNCDNSTMEEEAGDEYYEFDGAKLEIKHNTSISQSSVSIGPKITHSGYESSVLEGSDSPTSPNPVPAMAESSENNPTPADGKLEVEGQASGGENKVGHTKGAFKM